MTRITREMPSDTAQVLLIKDAARALRCNRRSLMKKLAEQNIPIVHFSSRWRCVRVSDLNRLIDAHLTPAA